MATETTNSLQPPHVELVLQEGLLFEAWGQDGAPLRLHAPIEHGGTAPGFHPMELLLLGLGGCTGMDVISILRKKRQDVTAYRVEVSGVQQDAYPHVYTDITIRHIVHGNDLSQEAVRRSIELSEAKYCPAFAMLSKAARVTSTFEVLPEAPSD
jgi:putative redox protein